MALDLFAGICVRDFATARDWYERLLGGSPSFLAHTTEAVWELAEHRSLYVVEDAAEPGTRSSPSSSTTSTLGSTASLHGAWSQRFARPTATASAR